MRYFALATDYDGTLASQGLVDDATVRALSRFVASGRRLVLVTGRQVDELEDVFPHLELFERIVAENGAVLFTPSSREVRALEPPPNPAFITALRARGVQPLAVGHVIVATCEPHETTVLDVIRTMGLELHVEFNKGSVMVLPAGVTKGTGLAAALLELGLSQHNVVGVGDAENDHALLALSECGVSVANALASLKDRSDWISSAAHGAGVSELIDRVLDDDLRSGAPARRRIPVGRSADGQALSLEPYGGSVMITGSSRPARAAIGAALFERLRDAHYQLCVVDTDGAHYELPTGAFFGSEEHAPAIQDMARSLADPRRSAVANLAAVPLEGRPSWFAALLSSLLELRARAGRPHWIVADEGHQLLPRHAEARQDGLPKRIGELLLLSAKPALVSSDVLAEIDTVIAAGPEAEESLREFAHASGRSVPELPDAAGGSLVWTTNERRALSVDVTPRRAQPAAEREKRLPG
ncbi:MAG: HAD-IIB family hydrolase [Myxococcota bacterium]|nr:HAD-IIB family hydrolase [Myxococcota bacterium]